MGRKLFEVLKEKLEANKIGKDIIDVIKSDSDLLDTSNSYCMQCGNCCNRFCRNKEEIGGLTCCLLHDKNYLGDKGILKYDDIYKMFDPDEFVKPLVCHTYGPHVIFLSLVGDSKVSEESLREQCPGGFYMFEDYKRFLKELE